MQCISIVSCQHFAKEIIEPAHDKTYNNTCATREHSDQPVHMYSLLRIFALRMSLPQPLCYPKRDELEPFLYCLDVQAGLSLCWSHKSYCSFFPALTQL